jgi:hypothetical protein
LGAGITAFALPFLVLSRRENAPADVVEVADAQPVQAAGSPPPASVAPNPVERESQGSIPKKNQG